MLCVCFHCRISVAGAIGRDVTKGIESLVDFITVTFEGCFVLLPPLLKAFLFRFHHLLKFFFFFFSDQQCCKGEQQPEMENTS